MDDAEDLRYLYGLSQGSDGRARIGAVLWLDAPLDLPRESVAQDVFRSACQDR